MWPCCCWLAAGTREDKKEAKFDAAKLVGTWNYTSGTKGGEKVVGDSLKADVVITKDTITLKGGPDMTFVIAYKIVGEGRRRKSTWKLPTARSKT